eukprot:SAG31_NODE_8714_length_1400_cov_2.177556_2_plen_194_part_01
MQLLGLARTLGGGVRRPLLQRRGTPAASVRLSPAAVPLRPASTIITVTARGRGAGAQRQAAAASWLLKSQLAPAVGAPAVSGLHTTPARLHSDPSTGAVSSREQQWQARFEQLQAYKDKHGDCNVPFGWAANPALGTWVSNQRAYKQRLDQGDANPGITSERVERLEAEGFEWDPNEQQWQARFEQLQAYKDKH